MADPGYQLKLTMPERGIVEITCEGYLAKGSEEYLPRLEKLVKEQSADVCLLYNALPLSGYDFGFPLAHIDPFRNWLGKLRKVGVAHTIASIGFAIATVSLASRANIKGFATRDAALAWLRLR